MSRQPDGPLLVLGGAGTGKTEFLRRRFGWLVEQGAPAHSLLVLASSARAASDMRTAIEERVEPPYEELHVHTFHSFCERLLRDEAPEAGLAPDFAAVSRADRVALLLDSIDELSLRRHEIRGNPAPLLAGFVSRIDRLKAGMTGHEQVAADAEELPDESDAQRSLRARELEFARLYADHDALLGERGALDAGDLVLRTFRLLHESPHVRERTAERFRHVLVDDLQEATYAQTTLLTLLCAEHERVTAAADDGLEEFRRAFPGAEQVQLSESSRCPSAVLAAAASVLGEPGPEGRDGGSVRLWRCTSERAQAQAVAAECERLVADGSAPDTIAVLVRSLAGDGSVIGSALEERALPFRLTGSAAYFQRAEVRDVLAWMRLLADPSDSGAVVRALSRPPIGLHSVDIARLTQLARRRKLDMPSAVGVALEGPQLTPEGRDRAQAFLRLYRGASAAFEDRSPDAFVLRLIERIGIRRQQVFATQADTVERLRNVAKLPDLATAYMRREPSATPRGFARYLKAVADSGLPEDEAGGPSASAAIEILTVEAARGRGFDHVFVVGQDAASHAGEEEAAARRRLYLAITRAAESAVLAWAGDRPSPLVEAVGITPERFEEELFGPGEGLHATFRAMRDELLDEVSHVGGRLGEMRLDTGVDVSNAVARFLELVKVAAVIDRSKSGQAVEEALSEVNALVSQSATAEEREILDASPLDAWLREGGRDPAQRPGVNGTEPSLDPFIPRRGDGLMLSASDIETYRLCPLKYKFARVFRIPQEATIHQRFGIALHQVLERFHQYGGGTREELFDLFETSWRRGGFGDTDDELQFRERALEALDLYWERCRDDAGEPVWFERSFSFKLGDHVLRGRVDRVDRLPDGTFELIDYKTGKPRTEDQLREDVQLSLYQMAANESWGIETSAQSYMYVMTGEKVPVAHSPEELDRVRATVEEIGEGILRQDFQPTPTQEICSFCDYRIICPAAER